MEITAVSTYAQRREASILEQLRIAPGVFSYGNGILSGDLRYGAGQRFIDFLMAASYERIPSQLNID